ncbi:MAG: IS66 family transposase [Pseudomonadota bacterium]|nr:IS66 family transposase [Pseudomonadota bacterium]
MQVLPDLDQLSAADKDALIRALFAQLTTLSAQVTELQGRLALNSSNSSRPPSSDGLAKPAPKSLRVAGQKPNGGQKGHSGHTLKSVTQPEHIQTHKPPSHCDVCARPLTVGQVLESRQVFDIPPVRYEVTEHQVLGARCSCGKLHSGAFPPAVTASVQYGPRIKAAVVNLTHQQMMPLARTGALLGDLYGLSLSDATVLAIHQEASERLQPIVQQIGQAIAAAPVAHADETGMRAKGKLQWMHVLATPTLTWVGAHAKRGKAAFEALGLLNQFTGTLVHDGWRPYRDLPCTHSLCNAHHLRELTYVFEEMEQAWAQPLITLLVDGCHEVHIAGQPLVQERITHYRARYNEILAQGQAVNPRAPRSGKRGGTKQSKALNLIDRLALYADDVWRFMTDVGVPFTNNTAEQAVRMPKVKQKVSGGFRTLEGLSTFCTIRSYLATLHKQGENLFEALVQTFQGAPTRPRFA